jgi:hypothetical protein
MELFHSLCSCLPANTLVSPDVGGIFGSRGFVDFYIGGNMKFGIEVARDGAELNRHLARFNAKEGIYPAIPFNSWIILDFRRKKVKQQSMKRGVLYVVFKDDFQTCSLFSASSSQLNVPPELKLEGDDSSLNEARKQFIRSDEFLSFLKTPTKPSVNRVTSSAEDLAPLSFDDDEADEDAETSSSSSS